MNRPNGITILAWIAIVGGAFGVLGAVVLIFASFALMALGTAVAGPSGFFAGLVALVSSLVLAAMSALGIAFGVGALSLKPWAWGLGVIWCYVAALWRVVDIFASRSVVGVFGALISAVIGIAVAAGLMYYLYTDEVRAAFGKSDQAAPSFMLPVFAQIDNMIASGRGGGQRPQAPGGYQPPQQPGGGGYPQAPVHYEGPQPPTPPTEGPTS